jgi:tRNA(fMet)-specific endonuclease VapC
MILDTNALSALFDGDPGLKVVIDKADRICLPVVVLGEYRFGLLGSRRRREAEADLERFQAIANVLMVDTETVRPYANISHQLKHAGKPIPANDMWIAALAIQHGLPIVSKDKHFDRVPGVRRIGW